MTLRDLRRLVRRPCVNNDDFVGNLSDAGQASTNEGCLIPGDQANGQQRRRRSPPLLLLAAFTLTLAPLRLRQGPDQFR